MKINGKEYLSPQEQLFENTKDIEKLKQLVKPVYQTTAELTSSSVSVALSDTNVGDATEGWLMTNDGLLFKITANDGTTVLLIYYSDLKGPQGIPGSDLYIDDSTTADDKTWSSNKIKAELDLISDKGIYYTIVQPTYNGAGYSLYVSNLGNPNQNIDIQEKDLIIYIDGDEKAKELYLCVGFNGDKTIMTLQKKADFGGKQLYQHNIYLDQYGLKLTLRIFNDNDTQFTLTSLKQFLTSKSFVYNVNPYECSGVYKPASTEYYFNMLGMNSNDMYVYNITTGLSIADSGGTLVDTIIAL